MCECNHLAHEPCRCLGAVAAVVKVGTNRERFMCSNCAKAISEALAGQIFVSINWSVNA